MSNEDVSCGLVASFFDSTACAWLAFASAKTARKKASARHGNGDEGPRASCDAFLGEL
jgi:hypothetical protein